MENQEQEPTQNIEESDSGLETIRKKVKEGRATKEEDIDIKNAIEKATKAEKTPELLSARKKMIENLKKERENLRQSLKEKQNAEKYPLIASQILNLGAEIEKLEAEIESIPSETTNAKTGVEKEPTFEELRDQFNENVRKWQNAINDCKKRYKNEKLDEEFAFTIGDDTFKVTIPANENIADNIFFGGSMAFAIGLKNEIKNLLEIENLKNKNLQLVFEIEKVQKFSQKVSDEIARRKLLKSVDKAFDEGVKPKSVTPDTPPEATIPLATEPEPTAKPPAAEPGAAAEPAEPAAAETTVPPTAEAEAPTTPEATAEEPPVLAGKKPPVDTGKKPPKSPSEAEDKDIEKGLKEFDDAFAAEQAKKKEQADYLREEILGIIEMAKRTDEALERNKGKVKELIENSDAVAKINNEIQEIERQVRAETNIDVLERLKREVSEKLLELEKEKTSLSKLGKKMETREFVEKIVEKVIGKPTEVVGKTGKVVGKVGGRVALYGLAWGAVFAGLLVKNSFKLAVAELKVIWGAVSEHIPGGKDFSRGWEMGRKTFAGKEEKSEKK